MKRILFILCAVIAATLCAMAQDPIRWRMNVKMTSATEGVVALRALVGDGWHLYSTSLPDGGPKPTKFSFEGSKGVKFTENVKVDHAPAEVNDAMFGMKLSWWAENVTFTRKFKLVNRDGAKVAVSVSFMGCNDASCLPPKTVNLTYEFKKQ